MNPDVEVTNHGSLFTFALLTEAARDWWDENVGADCLSWGGAYAVEPRFAWDIAQGMQSDGLEVQ